MELINLKYKYASVSGSFYTCKITDELNEIVGEKNKFLICKKGIENIYRIHYGNISIGDLACVIENNIISRVNKFTMYVGNFQFIVPHISNSTINIIYKYLKSLEGNVYFNR